MTSSPNPRQAYSGTYFVLDHSSEEELTRLMIQDQMLTSGMGGALPEQPADTVFRRVLDVGCGTGGWLLETARTYPTVSQLIGVDIDRKMIAYARNQAEQQQMQDRVEFHIMNALLALEFPANYLDLVNIRMGGSFLRVWEWPHVLHEFRRVTRPGGTIRIVESDVVGESNSPALNRLSSILVQTFHRAGYFFAPEHSGLIEELPHMLRQARIVDLQTRLYKLEFRAGTSEGEHFRQDMSHVVRTMAPFLRKWGCLPEDYQDLCQQAQKEMEQPDFRAVWGMFVIWGNNVPR